MKIIRHGVVIFTQGDIKIEGWNIEREPSDPADATDEQLLLAYAIHFAQEKFKSAMQGATMDLIRALFLKQKPNGEVQNEGHLRSN